MVVQWTCAIVLLIIIASAVASELVIPCDATAVTSLSSNHTYTLTNCTLPADSFVALTTAASETVVRNITVVVSGGNVLPSLRPLDSGVERIEHIMVAIHGVRGAAAATVRNNYAVFATNVRNVSNVTILVAMTAADIVVNASDATAAVLLVSLGGNLSVVGLNVTVMDSSMKYSCVHKFCQKVALINIFDTSVADHITVVFNNCSLGVASLADTYLNPAAAVVSSSSSIASSLLLSLRCGTSVTVDSFGGGQAAVFTLSGGTLSNARADIEASSCVVVRSACSSCGSSVAARAIAAQIRYSSIEKLAVSVLGGLFVMEAPARPAVVYINATALDGVHIQLMSCAVNTTSKPGAADFSGLSRQSNVVAVSGGVCINTNVTLEDTSFFASSESGGTQDVSVEMIGMGGRLLNTTLTLKNVTQRAILTNGTAPLFSPLLPIGYLVLHSKLLAVGTGYVLLPTATNCTFAISDSSLWSEHSARPTVGASQTNVASLIAAFAVTLPLLRNSTVSLSNVFVVRGTSSSLLSSGQVRSWDVTVLASFVQNLASMQFLFSEVQAPPFLLAMLNSQYAFDPALHFNTNTTISNGCAVDLDRSPTLSDQVGLVIFPDVLYSSHVTIVNAALLPTTLRPSNVGSLLLIVSSDKIVVQDCIVSASNISGHGVALLSVVDGNFTLNGTTLLTFHNVSVTTTIEANHPLDTRSGYVFAASSDNIWVARITITHSQFRGYSTLLNSKAFRTSTMLLHLGCNLWDGAPLPHTSIGYDAPLLPHIEYSRSAYNASTQCVGLPPTPTPTVTFAMVAEHIPDVHRLLTAETAALSVGVVYVSVINNIGRTAVAGVQRSIAALQLAASCAQPPGEDDSNDAPMFSQLVDNPLSLEVGAGSDALSYAAGAAVGNAVAVAAIAAILHVAHEAKHRARTSPSGVAAAALLVLPSSSLPGSIAVAYSRVVQPAVGACVALLVSGERSTRSVVCGAAMLALWLGYPLYCVLAVLHRGRRRGAFLLSSVSTRPKRHKDATNAAASVAQTVQGAVEYATEETARWVPHRGCARRGTAERKYAEFLLHKMEAVFGAFVGGREWYFAVEWGIAAASGAVLGAAEAVAAGGDACTAARWGGGSAVALCVLQLGLCVWLRPFSVRLELWMAVVPGCLELLSNVLSLAALVDAAGVVLNLSMVVELSVGFAGRLNDAWFWSSGCRNDSATKIAGAHSPNKSTLGPPRWVKCTSEVNHVDRGEHSEPLVQLKAVVELICSSRITSR